jgi:hypothetical protein
MKASRGLVTRRRNTELQPDRKWSREAERNGRTTRPTKSIQGREAPIVIYSMTTSTHADTPWDIGFPCETYA